MSVVVLDASVAVSWIVPGQATEVTRSLLADESIASFQAPYLFPAEVRNAVLKLERRGRCDPELTSRGLALLSALEIDVRAPLSIADCEPVLQLARDEALSFYDACYLDLAIRRGLSLASRDDPLLAAAKRRGVAVIHAGAAP